MSRIGIVISGVVQNTYLGAVFSGVAAGAKRHRCSLVTNFQNARRQDDLTHFLQRDCDGVVIVLPFNFEHVLELCRRYGRECVLIDYPAQGEAWGYPTVEAANREGVLSVMEHLFALGHRRIGFISGVPEHASGQQRLLAYREALVTAGIAYDPALVGNGGWVESLSFRVAQDFLAQRPTAIVASCDESAIATYRAARSLGLEIGRELSVTGFDDIALATSVTPALTTVHQPVYEFGRTAVELLLKRLNGEPLDDMHVRLPTQLIVRQSTGPAPR